MPIVDITGFTEEEAGEMTAVETAIQEAFKERWGLRRLDTTTVNFLACLNIKTSPDIHVMARVTTIRFDEMEKDEIEEVCWEVQKLLEQHGGHVFSEAWAHGYPNVMCGGWKEGYRPA